MAIGNCAVRGIIVVAGLWLAARSSAAAPSSDAFMEIGAPALPPPAYVAFCKRQPFDCGADAQWVVAGARQADADRAVLLAFASSRRGRPSASLPAALRSGSAASVRAAAVPTDGLPAMTPGLWATLNDVNARLNRAIVEQTDQRAYGVADYWTTPLANGGRFGDCEDYVLEKARALRRAGLPRRALDIALVTTPQGQSHAVLLVGTRAGEFVLDDLTPAVMPWRETDYLWRERQVNGDPFRWAMIEDPRLRRAVAALVARKAAKPPRERPVLVARR